MLTPSGKPLSWLRAAILAGLVATLPLVDRAEAAPGHGGGGAPHGGGGGGHGGGGGFHGGGGGFHGGGGMHVGGGARGGGFHAGHAAPGGRSGINVGHAQGGPAHGFAGGHAHGRNGGGSRSPSGLAAANRGPGGHAAGSNRAMQRNANAVGHALASRQIHGALHTPGGLRNPMTRAAITGAVAGAAFAHHQGGLWWRHAHGGYGWVGPVFWPYGYNDFSDYAWWGGDYDPTFWDYGYGDLYAGVFGPYDYESLNGYAGYLPATTGSIPTRSAKESDEGAETTATLAEMCGSDSQTVAGFPVEQFRGAIQPSPEQAAALDELANASRTAAETIRNACPRDVALTAPSRMAAMQQRVQAMRDGITSVKPALDKFYGLLSDDQKARITALAAEKRPAPRPSRSSNDSADGASCSTAATSATDWPSEAIDRNVKPSDAQRAGLTALQDAATKAADILKASCPPVEARTPPARLDAAAARLDTMLQAIGTIRPALDEFYGALSDEQKAAFDAIGPARSGPATASADDGAPRASHHRRRGVSVRGMMFRMMGM